jgi:hypothetical protein
MIKKNKIGKSSFVFLNLNFRLIKIDKIQLNKTTRSISSAIEKLAVPNFSGSLNAKGVKKATRYIPNLILLNVIKNIIKTILVKISLDFENRIKWAIVKRIPTNNNEKDANPMNLFLILYI